MSILASRDTSGSSDITLYTVPRLLLANWFLDTALAAERKLKFQQISLFFFLSLSSRSMGVLLPRLFLRFSNFSIKIRRRMMDGQHPVIYPFIREDLFNPDQVHQGK